MRNFQKKAKKKKIIMMMKEKKEKFNMKSVQLRLYVNGH